MTLTDLANHICEQCGMKEAEDTSAAKMFLQRRIEMIWNQSLWRCSLVEATMTLNTDGTSTLADTVWIPSRGTLLLPTVMDSVLAVRQDSHSMNVASLESYYRRDDDALAAQGDPTEFQVLSPAVLENSLDIPIFINLDTANTSEVITSITLGDSTGTNIIRKSVSVSTTPNYLGTYKNVFSLSKPVITGNVLLQTGGVQILNSYSQQIDFQMTDSDGGFYDYFLNPGEYSPLVYKTITSFGVAGGTQQVCNVNFALITLTDVIPGFPSIPTFTITQPNQSIIYTMEGALKTATKHPRIRLTSIPTAAVNLRVLGKSACPVLGDYDEAPINNAELCLMAFARGDMLMRQRQHGKAQLAQQEGAVLLKQLQDSESYQTANRHQIIPDGGFGDSETAGIW